MTFQELSLYKDRMHGLKLVDTSFFGEHLHFLNRRVSEIIVLVQQAQDAYNGIEDILDSSITFPAETISEFCRGVVGLRRLAKSIKKSLKPGQVNYMKRKDFAYVAQRLLNLVEVKKRFVRRVLLKHPTEQYLDSSWTRYLPAVCEVAQRPGIKVNYNSRYDGRPSSGLHLDFDEKIFAKALSLSQRGRIYLLTGDSDFQRMHKAFYNQLDNFAEKYGFPLPNYPVSLLLEFGRGLELVDPLKKPKLISKNIERLIFHQEDVVR